MDQKPSILARVLIPLIFGGSLFPMPQQSIAQETKNSVKVLRSREMIDALKAVGSPVKYTEYPGVNHDSWTATYSNPDLYQWLFSQQKN